MRKIWSVCALALGCLLLCACTPKLPEGMDADTLTENAGYFIDAVSTRNYASVASMYALEEPSQSEWAELLDPLLDEFGAFERTHGVSFATTDSASYGELAVALVDTQYANKRVVWQVSFTLDYEIVGLHV